MARSILFLFATLFALALLAGPLSVNVLADGPTPKPGLEQGLTKPATPEPVCPKGMKWSAKVDECVSAMEAQDGTPGSAGDPMEQRLEDTLQNVHQ